MTSTVAFLGLGAMGAPMARNLLKAGCALRVWNRSAARTQPFADTGITVCDSIATAVQGAGFVVSIVADDAASRAVMLGQHGVMANAAPGTVVIDSSTNTPALARELAAAGAARGIAYLDAPVSGSVPQATSGELVFMVGGDAAALAKAQPLLAAMGKQHELKGHVRGALNNGVTPEELREVMLHATVYCGYPTAIDAFRTVAEVVEPR